MPDQTLYERLGGYDALAATAANLLPRVMNDDRLGRFWENRGDDGIAREGQLLIDFLCASCGGPIMYRGRDMVLTHKGMGIDRDDWKCFIKHLIDTLDDLGVGDQEMNDVLSFIQSFEGDIVD
jgi:hemoglobin